MGIAKVISCFMAKVEHYFTKFELGEFYHVYNRTVDRQCMFKNEANNRFFLVQLQHFMENIVTIYAYCLLENHFHLLIKITDDLTEYRSKKRISDSITTHTIVSKQLRRFFQCYALKFNHENDRCGTLFQTPFKRSLVNNHQYLTHLIYYIHTNPQKHQLTADFENWRWNSYTDIMQGNSEYKQEILSWFGGITGYINFHSPRINDFDNL